MSFISAEELPIVKAALKKARKVNEYFKKSTQATSKLKKQQKSSSVPQYKNLKVALNVLQDVVTRWWSTHRSLK